MTRVELREQGRGPKNRKRTSLRLLTTCMSEVCLCTLWLGGAGAESCRAGPPPPYTGTDWVSNCSPAEVRNQKSHTTCPRGVRSWQADVVRQSSRCRLGSDCFPLSLASATGDPHLSWLSAAWSVEQLAKTTPVKQTSLAHRAYCHGWCPTGTKGADPKTEHPPLSAQVSLIYLIYARVICSARNGYASTWYFGTDYYCSAPHSQVPISLLRPLSGVLPVSSFVCHSPSSRSFQVSPITRAPRHRIGAPAQQEPILWAVLPVSERCSQGLNGPNITRRSVLSVFGSDPCVIFPSWRASALI